MPKGKQKQNVMNETLKIMAYLIYIGFACGITVLVTRSLFNYGKKMSRFLRPEEEEFTDSLAGLMKIGFYLMTLGFGFLIIKISYNLESKHELIEKVTYKGGSFLLFVGVLVFFQLFIFLSLQRKRKQIEQ